MWNEIVSFELKIANPLSCIAGGSLLSEKLAITSFDENLSLGHANIFVKGLF